jgi:hypothetical protein
MLSVDSIDGYLYYYEMEDRWILKKSLESRSLINLHSICLRLNPLVVLTTIYHDEKDLELFLLSRIAHPELFLIDPQACFRSLGRFLLENV